MASRKNPKKEGGRRKHRGTKRKSHSRRHTHKGKHGTPSWPQFVKKTYMEMKRSNPSATFRDAMVKASKLKKEGKYHM